MFVDEWPRGRHGRGQRDLIEAVLEDGIDVAIRASADGAGAGARGLHPRRPIAFGEAQDAQAGEVIDPAVAQGRWTWTWSARGLGFSRRRQRR